MIAAACFSASAARCCPAERASASSCEIFFCASDRLWLPRSAAARPSAIFFWRSSSALISGGQMYFIVTQAPMKKTTS